MFRTSVLWIALALAAWTMGCGSTRSSDVPDVVSPDAVAEEVAVPDVFEPDSLDPDTVDPDTVHTDTIAHDHLPGDQAPIIQKITVEDSDRIGLVLWLEVRTDLPTRLVVGLENLATGKSVPVPYGDALKAVHKLVVMDLRAESAYRIHIQAISAADVAAIGHVDVTTPPLPAFLGDLEVEVIDADRMQPGYTLFSGMYEDGPVYRYQYTVALDGAGEVAFYHHQGGGTSYVPTHSGTYLVDTEHGGPIIISDLLGLVTQGSLEPGDFGTPAFHHWPGVTGDGNYLAIGVEMRTIGGFPGLGGGTLTYNIVGDVFYEIDPSGDLIREIRLLDLLDPRRLLGNYNDGFWDMDFPGAPGGTKDWSHSNSIATDPDTGDYVMSVANQSWVVKVDRNTGALLWRLGVEGDFMLAHGGRWSMFHHSAVPLPGNRILLFDNAPGDNSMYSRAVEYEVDTATWVATQTWEHLVEPPAVTSMMGEVRKLDNGNVLICEGALALDPGNPGDTLSVRIVEVTSTAPSEEVLRATLKAPPGEMMNSYQAMSISRIPSLY
ncbi:MAG: aryl-sulfate sulfotransferase [Pseudomonadota bacterium]